MKQKLRKARPIYKNKSSLLRHIIGDYKVRFNWIDKFSKLMDALNQKTEKPIKQAKAKIPGRYLVKNNQDGSGWNAKPVISKTSRLRLVFSYR